MKYVLYYNKEAGFFYDSLNVLQYISIFSRQINLDKFKHMEFRLFKQILKENTGTELPDLNIPGPLGTLVLHKSRFLQSIKCFANGCLWPHVKPLVIHGDNPNSLLKRQITILRLIFLTKHKVVFVFLQQLMGAQLLDVVLNLNIIVPLQLILHLNRYVS